MCWHLSWFYIFTAMHVLALSVRCYSRGTRLRVAGLILSKKSSTICLVTPRVPSSELTEAAAAAWP